MTPTKAQNYAASTDPMVPGSKGRDSASVHRPVPDSRGFLWTLYGCNPANPRKADSKTAAYHDLRFLIHAAWRSWRAWHIGEAGAVVDHDGSLSEEDRDLLAALDIAIIVPSVSFDPPSTLNKLVSLAHSPWPLTMHVDLDIVWTGNAEPIWTAPLPPWDLAGVDYGYGHRYPIGVRKGEAMSIDGTPRVPCACLLLCRVAASLLDLETLAISGEWSDEVLMARAELAGRLKLGRIPNYYVWDTWEGSGWKLEYTPAIYAWTLTDPNGGAHSPLALHWGGGHGKRKALASQELAHYLGALYLRGVTPYPK